MKRLILVLALLAAPITVGAQVVQDAVYQCTDSSTLLIYTVNAWGPAVCVPPTPYDLFGKPGVGWGGTPACTTGGSFDCAVGDTYTQTQVGSATGYVQSSAAVVLTTGTVTNLPGMVLNAFSVEATTPAARSAISVTVDVGVQINSLLAAVFNVSDILLFRDQVGQASVQIAQRRAHAVNQGVAGGPAVNQAVEQTSFTVVDRPPAGGVYSYRVAAQVIANNNGAGLAVGGSATVTPWLRGTLSASQINW